MTPTPAPDNATPAAPGPWTWHQRTLNLLRTRLVAEVAEHRRETAAPVRGNNDDFSDVAREESEHELIFAELAAEENQLAEVEAALDRLRAGTYGICVLSGVPIEPARLRALPWTPFCRAAAESRAPRGPKR